MTPNERYRRTPRGKYTLHKINAKRRGVPFLLTFGQWWVIWCFSGKWKRRGWRPGRFVMCRVGDAGAYEWGNVYIGPAKHNLRDAAKKGGMVVKRRHTARSTTVWFDSPQLPDDAQHTPQREAGEGGPHDATGTA